MLIIALSLAMPLLQIEATVTIKDTSLYRNYDAGMHIVLPPQGVTI